MCEVSWSFSLPNGASAAPHFELGDSPVPSTLGHTHPKSKNMISYGKFANLPLILDLM